MAISKRILRTSVALAVFICVILPLSSLIFAATSIELLLTGEFHGDEVSAATGEQWLGLFRTDTGFELAETVVEIEYFEDPILDDTGEKTGKAVGVRRDGKPVFMLRGIAGLGEGPVASSFDGWDWLNPGVTKELQLAGKTFSLSAYGQGEDKWNIKDYSLTLSSGGVTQEIVRYETCCNDSMPALVWAGDLDGDGALDLYVDISDHYNVAERALFLSSLAGEGELVGKAAKFVTYGC